MRALAAAVLVALLGGTACSEPEDFDITLDARVDLDALLDAQGRPSSSVVQRPGGMTLQVELSQLVDLLAERRSAAQMVVDGAIIEVRGLEVRALENTLTVDMPPLLLLVSDPDEMDPRAAQAVAQVDGIHVGALARPGDAVWTAVGPTRLEAALRALHFRAHLAGTLRLAQGDEVPAGAVELEIVLHVRVTER